TSRLPKGSDNSFDIALRHRPRLPLKYGVFYDRRRDRINVRHDRLTAGVRKLAKNAAAVLAHRRSKPGEARNQRVRVNPNLPRGALTALFNVSVPGYQKPGAAACQRAIEVD